MSADSQSALAYAVAAYENHVAGHMSGPLTGAALKWCCPPLETDVQELLLMVSFEMRDREEG